MKKLTVIVILLLIAGMSGFSQKKNGTVYAEHEAIEKTKAMWEAFVNGDVEKYTSYFADTVSFSTNGAAMKKRTHEDLVQSMKYWMKNYSHLSIMDQKPAYPDAIEYKEAGTWVQDWLIVKGIHKESGIVLNLPIHNIYAFDKEGKIAMIGNYYDDDVFTRIDKSKETTLNGKVFDNHPNIVTVRKAMNAFQAGDLDAWAAFFSPKATFASTTDEFGTSASLEEMKAYMKGKFFKEGVKFKVEEVGYPDCVYYAKNDLFVVYSWWKMTVAKNGEKFVFGFMLSHNFNKDGEITNMISYISSNHLDRF